MTTNLWIGDYANLRNEIHYLEFKLTDSAISTKEKQDAQKLLEERLYREGQFKVILGSFKGIENQILIGRYVQDKTLETIAEQNNLSASYIYKKHSSMMRVLSKFDELYSELQALKKNYPVKSTN